MAASSDPHACFSARRSESRRSYAQHRWSSRATRRAPGLTASGIPASCAFTISSSDSIASKSVRALLSLCNAAERFGFGECARRPAAMDRGTQTRRQGSWTQSTAFARIPDLPAVAPERGGSTLKRHSPLRRRIVGLSGKRSSRQTSGHADDRIKPACRAAPSLLSGRACRSLR
jgi:hypothetical protein